MSAKNKTQPTRMTLPTYLATLQSDKARADAKKLIAVFEDATKAKAVIWGKMVGFGSYHYVYESGREGDMFVTGFAMRKESPTIYATGCDYAKMSLGNLGPHKISGSCLHIKDVEKTDLTLVKNIILEGIAAMKKKYPIVLA